MKNHIGMTIDVELFKKIERLRGREKRSTFMEYLLRLGLKELTKQQKQEQRRL